MSSSGIQNYFYTAVSLPASFSANRLLTLSTGIESHPLRAVVDPFVKTLHPAVIFIDHSVDISFQESKIPLIFNLKPVFCSNKLASDGCLNQTTKIDILH